MDSNPINLRDANSVRQKLVNAERKYYTNLHMLQEKLAGLEAIQTLSENLIVCTEPTDVLNRLVETTIKYMGVEKVVVIQPDGGRYKVVAIKGYSRKQVNELRQTVISEKMVTSLRSFQKGRQNYSAALMGNYRICCSSVR